MRRFKEISASVVGGVLGLGLLWFFASANVNPVALPYDLARWAFQSAGSFVSAAPATQEKVWIVVSFSLPDGRTASMSFDNPSTPDLTVDACMTTKETALPYLKDHIATVTGESDITIQDTTCVASARDPIQP